MPTTTLVVYCSYDYCCHYFFYCYCFNPGMDETSLISGVPTTYNNTLVYYY